MTLDSRELTILRTARIILWGIFVVACLGAFSHFFFPSRMATYDFLKGQIIKELPDQGAVKRDLDRDGLLKKESPASFDIEAIGNYSDITLRIDLKEGSARDMGELRIRKGYKAAFAETGTESLLPPGSLLRAQAGFFFVLPDSSLARFDSISTVRELGWDEGSFETLSPDEIGSYAVAPKTWTAGKGYPEGSLIDIDGDFYALENGMLSSFVSKSAFLSRHPKKFAAKGKPEILKNYPRGDEMIGFSNSTLLSFDSSVFIIDGASAYPIADAATFESFGLDWDDVVPANSEEIGIYRKGRQFTILDAHPDGSVFRDRTTGDVFVVQDKTLRPVKSSALRSFLARKSPVEADIGGMEAPLCAQWESPSFAKGVISCRQSLSSWADAPGNTYRVTVAPAEDIRIAELSARLGQYITWSNLRVLLAKLKAQAIGRL